VRRGGLIAGAVLACSLSWVGGSGGVGWADGAESGGAAGEVSILLTSGGAAPVSHRDLRQALAAARDGDRVEVFGGVHRGPFEVASAVELIGAGRPVLDGGGEGDVVVVSAPGARIEGFEIRGSGARSDKEHAGVRAEAGVAIIDNSFEDVLYGINLKAARGSKVSGNHIRGRDIHVARRGDGIRLWESHGSSITGNTVTGARDIVIWYSEDLTIADNTVRDGRYGLHYMYSHSSTIEGNRLLDNSVGAFLMYSSDLRVSGNLLAGNDGPSGYGLALKDCDEVEVSDNVVAGNRVGLYLDNTPARRGVVDRVESNTFAWNDIGVLSMPAVRNNVFTRNTFHENMQQVALTTTGAFEGNEWVADGEGNYWSTYAGFDENGDGIGDLPYEQARLFDDLLRDRPELRLFALSPAQSALDLAARAFPVFAPAPIFADPAPLMRAPEPSIEVPETGRRPMVLSSLALLAGALAVAAWGRGRTWAAGSASTGIGRSGESRDGRSQREPLDGS